MDPFLMYVAGGIALLLIAGVYALWKARNEPRLPYYKPHQK